MNTEEIAGGSSSVIVYGPQGCGKTQHGTQLARHFGVKHWGDLDELGQGAGGQYKVPARNYLLLWPWHPADLAIMPAGVRVLSFADATFQAGIKLRPEFLARALGRSQ